MAFLATRRFTSTLALHPILKCQVNQIRADPYSANIPHPSVFLLAHVLHILHTSSAGVLLFFSIADSHERFSSISVPQ